MTDYVNKATSAPKTNASGKANDDLGKDAFLKLLVAQLKYQDPSNPTDNSQFIAQTAQYSTVEKLAEMATGQKDLLTAQLQLGASNLIGRSVTYVGAEGTLASGIVTSATFSGSTPTLRVGDMDVALSSVKEVRNG